MERETTACLTAGFEARSDVRTTVRTARAGLEPEERDGVTRGGTANPTIGSKKTSRKGCFRIVGFEQEEVMRKRAYRFGEFLYKIIEYFKFFKSSVHLHRHCIF
jgi:hypothetical protein